MLREKRKFIRPLLLALMLVLGPVHAQIVLACAVMDTVMHDDCSCNGHQEDKDCVDQGFDSTTDLGSDTCWELSVELSIDEDAIQSKPIVKPAEVRADVDKPQTVAISFDLLEPPRAVAVLGINQSHLVLCRYGTDTYLITQRLRI